MVYTRILSIFISLCFVFFRVTIQIWIIFRGGEPMIRYDRLWKTMEDKELTQYRLIKQHGFSAGQIGRLKKNMHVSTHTIDTLCTILQCGINDIMEFYPGDADSWTGSLPEEAAAPAPRKPKEKKAGKGKAADEKLEKASKKAEKERDEKVEKTLKEKDGKADEKPAKEKGGKADEKLAKEKGGKADEKPVKEKSPKEKKAGKSEKAKKEKGDKKGKGGKKK